MRRCGHFWLGLTQPERPVSRVLQKDLLARFGALGTWRAPLGPSPYNDVSTSANRVPALRHFGLHGMVLCTSDGLSGTPCKACEVLDQQESKSEPAKEARCDLGRPVEGGQPPREQSFKSSSQVSCGNL